MEVSKRRQFRSKSMIEEQLRSQALSGLSIKSYCAQQGIPTGTFHNWKKRYEQAEQVSATKGFDPAYVSADKVDGLFAEVNGIRLYQPVSAGYLKELAS